MNNKPIGNTASSTHSYVRASVVWGLAAFFYFYELMLLVSPSVMVDDLTRTYSATAEQLGSLAAFYYYAYAAMQIPVGLLMDRFGPRILLTVAAGLCAIGCVIFGMAPTILIAQIGRFVMGLGGAFAVVGCLKLASLWFPVNRFALLTGIMVAVGMMGGVFGQAPVAKLVMSIGWRETMYIGAAMGGVLSILIWSIVSNRPPHSSMPERTRSVPFGEEIQIWVKFSLLFVIFCFPFVVSQQVKHHFMLMHSIMLYGLFYLGWAFCWRLYRHATFGIKNVRLAIALVGLLSAAYLLTQFAVSEVHFALLSLSMGFFARLLFGRSLPIPHGLYQVMKTSQVWVVSLYAGLMFVPTTGFGQLWGVPYFTLRFQLEKDMAGLMVSMIFFGWALGGPLYGWVSDRIGMRRRPMIFAASMTLIVMLGILYLPVSPFQMKVLMFLLGAFSSGFILAFSVVREINTPLLTGTAIGFINTLNNASGAIAQPVVGKLLDKYWDGSVLADGSPFYSLSMYNTAFLFLPICIGIALLLLPFIRETYCRSVLPPAGKL